MYNCEEALKIITVTARNVVACHNILMQTLLLQRGLIRNRNTAISTEGFLISSFDCVELTGLIDHGAKLHTAWFGEKMAGYLLATDIVEFQSLYQDGNSQQSIGKFLTSQPKDFDKFDYLYQIAVASHFKGQGIGRQLLSTAMQIARKGILTDVLIRPVDNSISHVFFKKNDFVEIGILELGEYRDFGELKSQVYAWENTSRGKVQ